MAAIKLVYLGGGSTRAPGTLASIVSHARHFAGSEVVLVDLKPDRLALVRRLGQRLIEAEGADLRLSATTDRAAALEGADAVLASFRPGGFEARRLDERIPLKYNLIGQETQGPGGFFMALRTIHVMRAITAEMERLCPQAWLINYTNPINLVSEAITHHSPIRTISLCEGPIIFPRGAARACGLDPDRLDAVMIGLNHACWSVRHLYDGQDVIPLMQAAYDRVMADPAISRERKRMVELACLLGHLPAAYMQYYYYRDEVLAEMQAAPQTRAETILAEVDSYWAHYAEQAGADRPVLDPRRSRGGLLELELAVEVLAAIVDDLSLVYPCNVPNGGAIPTFAPDRVVEVPCLVNRHGAAPLAQPSLPRVVAGLIEMLGEYQALAAEAAWHGTRLDAVRALAANPLVLDAKKAGLVYDEMARAHREYLPERLRT
jgi:6-phospho-beta-glucosidase